MGLGVRKSYLTNIAMDMYKFEAMARVGDYRELLSESAVNAFVVLGSVMKPYKALFCFWYFFFGGGAGGVPIVFKLCWTST